MTEEERARLLADLERLLNRAGLGFVVAQERVIAAEGTFLTSEDLPTRDQTFDVFQSTSSGSAARPGSLWDESELRAVRKERLKSGDVVVAPLDVDARLALLLDLLEVATAGTVAMEQVVVREFRTESADGHLTFEDPPEAELRGQSRESWTLSADAADTEAGARKVAGLVDSLREVAGVPRGQWLVPHSRDVGAFSWSVSER